MAWMSGSSVSGIVGRRPDSRSATVIAYTRGKVCPVTGRV